MAKQVIRRITTSFLKRFDTRHCLLKIYTLFCSQWFVLQNQEENLSKTTDISHDSMVFVSHTGNNIVHDRADGFN